ncbi:trace amine-associated receptor 4-like isoform X1 [Syngnathoides biaculeatus]|uniref:trace amine-associated receptor 4-like isoform X1 n=1 Tax=Syngnathoides biaculeatus TaxID=300417 RepID=UPI002ADD5807|nr:trace amine-associated receptor 4-like isoform X1 [Syngnathoides biaculeatus]XP_061696850.1 trace amine-associated receptor 4-like isoform X1 [Syngnathoides biaculeatus]XP_061696851.1 trace amine-associated receptor 4-like isoform X1 [Syngnathoides biaculeatus]XP_061696852.1 trace amine-associated receptor 4-like isoform X1 [Syngnathoides biaculeatus]
MMAVPVEGELCFPQLVNTSCRKTQRPHLVTSYMLLSVISLITVTLNLLVIISISHFKQLHTPTNLLLLSLAISDFLVGFLLLFQISLLDGCWFFGDLMCVVYYIVDHSVTSASIGSMVFISVDRYIAICDPLCYTVKVTKTRVDISVYLCWATSFVFHSMCSLDSLKQPGRFNSCVGECVIVVTYVVGITDLFVSFIGPITVILVLHMKVFAVAISQARALRTCTGGVTLQGAATRRSELKAARTLGVVVVVFIACIMPYFCIVISGQDVLLNASSATFIICLFYFNSCLNPLIYAIFYPWFRKSIKLIVTMQILKPDSCQTTIM